MKKEAAAAGVVEMVESLWGFKKEEGRLLSRLSQFIFFAALSANICQLACAVCIESSSVCVCVCVIMEDN